MERPDEYLDYSIDPIFQELNILLVLSFENNEHRTRHIGYFVPKVEIKDYNFLMDGQNFFDQPVKNNLGTYDNIRKNATDQGDEYMNGRLLDYPYFKENYKLIIIDLSKQQALDADPKAIQEINFTGNLARNLIANTTIFFLIEEAKEII